MESNLLSSVVSSLEQNEEHDEVREGVRGEDIDVAGEGVAKEGADIETVIRRGFMVAIGGECTVGEMVEGFDEEDGARERGDTVSIPSSAQEGGVGDVVDGVGDTVDTVDAVDDAGDDVPPICDGSGESSISGTSLFDIRSVYNKHQDMKGS